MADIRNIYEFLGEKKLPITETNLNAVIKAIDGKIRYYDGDNVTAEDIPKKKEMKEALNNLKKHL